MSGAPIPPNVSPPNVSPPNVSPSIQDLEYLYASNANVSNFVSVKLSGNRNYHFWKAQMFCLMDSHNMRGIVDPKFVGPKDASMQTMGKYDILLRGWMLGSVSEDVLFDIFNLHSAKSVWEKLISMYDPTMSFQQGSASNILQLKARLQRTNTKLYNTKLNKKLRKATMEGKWWEAETILRKNEKLAGEAISSDGNTILHIAVGTGHNIFVKRLLQFIKDDVVLESKNFDGSTALHIAAIVGNTYAADLLVKRRKILLEISDDKNNQPLLKAYYSMQLATFLYLLKAPLNNKKTKHKRLNSSSFPSLDPQKGSTLLLNAISAKEYNLASELVKVYPELTVKNDNVLVAIARTFPSGLDYVETLIYPSFHNICQRIILRSALLFYSLELFQIAAKEITSRMGRCKIKFFDGVLSGLVMILLVPVVLIVSLYRMIRLLTLMVYFPFFMLYFVLWKAGIAIVPPIERIEKKLKNRQEAKEVLTFVCDEIDKLEYSGSYHPYYERSILEAACENAYEVVDEILSRFPEVIECKNESGYDIIQLAVIHRSEKIYNLVYHIGERKDLYRTVLDSHNNNILHLAGRMAPSHELNRRTGAALQLQRELQWREEVQKLVIPTYITGENIFKENPNMIFTREHNNLVKEGESWMKTTAESCTIAAALITTIVFAAAITVPGGSNQETGIPLFTKNIAFIIFAIADAISLFASTTSLLMFLSILTARFAEQDFLVRLPRRLIIGLCTLLLSTTAMMVASGATFFLVFGHQKLWMLAPVCGIACIPIALFVSLQFPLIIDLYRLTYVPIFGKQSNSDSTRFNPDNMHLFYLQVK